jgi:hypothetical protein
MHFDRKNAWLFNNEDPHIIKCKEYFEKEFDLVIYRLKSSRIAEMRSWLCNFFHVHFLYFFFNKISVGGFPLLFHKKNTHTM